MKFSSLLQFLVAVVAIIPLEVKAASWRFEDKVYIGNLKPQAQVKISVEHTTFRKLLANRCGEVSFESKSLPTLIIINGKETLEPAKFLLEPQRKCTKDTPKSSISYKVSPVKFIIAGLEPNKSAFVKIVKPRTKNLSTNKCGVGAIAINKSLTAFANSHEDNIYSINGIKLNNISVLRAAPKCKNQKLELPS